MRMSEWGADVVSSDLISPGGVPSQLIEAWLDRKFILVSHALQLDELREVSRREKIRSLIRPSEAGRLINQISAVAQIPVALPNVARSPDPRDDFLFGLCEAETADWLVTGDKDALLSLKSPAGVGIVTPSYLTKMTGLGR